MTLRHYKIFIRVMEQLNMTAAAQDLYLSQPAVSQAIKELEEHFGIKLFERSAKALKATPDALMLREYVDSLLVCESNIEKRLWMKNPSPELCLGLDTPSWDLFMPQLADRYRQEIGECSLVLHTNPTGVLMYAIATKELDFALVNGSLLPAAALAVHKLAEDKLVFVCRRDSRYISPGEDGSIEITPDEIATWPLLLPYKNSAARTTFNGAMSAHEIEYKVAGHFNNDSLLLRAVMADMGIGVISANEKIDKEQLRTFTIKGLDIRSDISLIYYRNSSLTPEMERFRDFVVDNFRLC